MTSKLGAKTSSRSRTASLAVGDDCLAEIMHSSSHLTDPLQLTLLIGVEKEGVARGYRHARMYHANFAELSFTAQLLSSTA